MDSARFDSLSRALYDARSRRGLARLLGALTLGGILTAGTIPTAAKKGGKGKGKGKNKKGKKVTICHNGQTITVSKSALKGHTKHGDSEGPCPTPNPPDPCPGETFPFAGRCVLPCSSSSCNNGGCGEAFGGDEQICVDGAPCGGLEACDAQSDCDADEVCVDALSPCTPGVCRTLKFD